MKKMSRTTIFFGSGPVAAESLVVLIKHFKVEAVITKSNPEHHRGIAPVEELAKYNKLPVFFANNKLEIDELINRHAFSSNIGIVVDYGVIISKEAIDSFPLGIVNSHFSLLPQWRGADPITFSILSGQPKTGVSLMLIEPSLDTGKLLTHKSLPIRPDDTAASLTMRLIELSNNLLLEYLPKYMTGLIKARNQPHPDRATYSRKITKEDGIIDWSKPAKQIEREIRAYFGWPGSRCEIAGKQVTITKARIIEGSPNHKTGHVTVDNKRLVVQCGMQALVMELLKPSGKNEMSGESFVRGYLQNLP